MIISLIVAFAVNERNSQVIGKDNKIPWHSPTDLRRFKEYTYGHPIIMGRKTHQSIGRVLPGRENIIITRQKNFSSPNTKVFNDLEEGLKYAGTLSSEVFIIGGEDLYKQTINRAERLYITEMEINNVQGDAFFPHFSSSEFREILKESHPGEIFKIYQRVRKDASANSDAQTLFDAPADSYAIPDPAWVYSE